MIFNCLFLSLSWRSEIIFFDIFSPSFNSKRFWSMMYSLLVLSNLSSRYLMVFSCSLIWFFYSRCLRWPLRESSILSFWSWMSYQMVCWIFYICDYNFIFSSRYFLASIYTTFLFWFFYFSRTFCFSIKAFLLSKDYDISFMLSFSELIIFFKFCKK